MSNRRKIKPPASRKARPPKVRPFQRMKVGGASIIAGKMMATYRPGIHSPKRRNSSAGRKGRGK